MVVSISIWSAGVRRDRDIRRAARFVAWTLADWPLFGRVGCRATDKEIGDEIGDAPNTIKNSILELRARGHINWTWRRIRGSNIRTIFPVLPAGQLSAPPAVATSALTVGAYAELEPITPQSAECICEEVAANNIDEQREIDRSDAWRYEPFSNWQLKRQRAHVRRLIEALPDAGWYARCSEIGCQTPAAYICAEEGTAFCRSHRRYACHRVPLATFNLGPEAWAGRAKDDGDFRGW